jgi:hypothetical protein
MRKVAVFDSFNKVADTQIVKKERIQQLPEGPEK